MLISVIEIYHNIVTELNNSKPHDTIVPLLRTHSVQRVVITLRHLEETVAVGDEGTRLFCGYERTWKGM